MNDERNLSIRVLLLPKDTNAHGTIFGGVILSQIDLAGAVEARRHTHHKVVTVAIREVEFHLPVHVGDVVSFYTRCVRRGRTSLTIHVDVEAARQTAPSDPIKVTAFIAPSPEIRRAVEGQISRYQRFKSDMELSFIDPSTQPQKVRELGIGASGEVIVEYQGRSENTDRCHMSDRNTETKPG